MRAVVVEEAVLPVVAELVGHHASEQTQRRVRVRPCKQQAALEVQDTVRPRDWAEPEELVQAATPISLVKVALVVAVAPSMPMLVVLEDPLRGAAAADMARAVTLLE